MRESGFPLTYVLTTFNKLTFLRTTMERLLANSAADEEIVVTDGGSTDGTAEYLSELHRAGRIHQFVSERDFGEAHGMNKAILMARGELIKSITDDDVFYYPGIAKCRDFMLAHPEVDVMGENHLSLAAGGIARRDEGAGFRGWLSNHKPFAFCGLTLLLRRASLPLIGLPSTQHIAVDEEYGHRLTWLGEKLNMAWYSGTVVMHVQNTASNGQKFAKALFDDRRRIQATYSHYDSSASCLRNAFAQVKAAYHASREEQLLREHFGSQQICPASEFAATVVKGEKMLGEDNLKYPGEFIVRMTL